MRLSTSLVGGKRLMHEGHYCYWVLHSQRLEVGAIGMVGHVGRRKAVVSYAAGDEVTQYLRGIGGVKSKVTQLGEKGVETWCVCVCAYVVYMQVYGRVY